MARPTAARRAAAASLALAPLALAAAAAGCDGGAAASPSSRAAALVYGADDRLDYYQVPDPALRALMAETVVALIPTAYLRAGRDGRAVVEAPSWGEAASLCPDEPFAAQPAAAFCTGVLLDWDLVLTAGHCVRLQRLEDIAIVFGYVETAPGMLVPDADFARPIAIVAEALDPEGKEPRLDYAWLRLDRPVSWPRAPAAVHRAPPSALAPGDALIAIGASGGSPLKLDQGGRVIDARAATADYFVADTDTFHGASGGGAFDADLVLAGVLARGQVDLAPTAAGCNVTVREPDGGAAAEQFTYAARALDGLCAANPSASSLCRADCGQPCRALSPPPSSGCAVAGTTSRSFMITSLPLCCALAFAARRGVRPRRR